MEENISYQKKIGKGTIKSYREITQKFKNNIEKVIKLDQSYPLFLDTNVLLRTYSISFKAREKVFGFLNKRKADIYLPNIVQSEFIKNREEVINRFFETVTEKIPNDFKNEVINQIGSYLERNRVVFKDYTKVESDLNEIKVRCEKVYEILIDEISKQEKENSKLLFEDKQLTLLERTNVLDPLSVEELECCKNEYNELFKGVDPDKINSIISKPGKVFPGLADMKEKPDNPYGDYIIFYELMKYAKENKKDIIFLTYDTTKGDWMRKDKRPYLHYVENFFLNTGQIIFILDAERIFEDLLDISFKSLIQIKNDEKNTNLITIESLTNYLSSKFSNIDLPDNENELQIFHSELIKNGYTTIDQIDFDISRADLAFDEFIKIREKSLNRFTRIGNARIRLHMSNDNYSYWNTVNNSWELVNKVGYSNFKHLIK